MAAPWSRGKHWFINRKKRASHQAKFCSSLLSTSYYGYLKIFTDGSKDPKGQCDIGIYIPEFEKGYGYRVSDFLSVYSIEMTAIITALRLVVDTKL